MLSISSVRSASGAANYFAKDNYYTLEESAEASGWAGAGAEQLGLEGEVAKDRFEAILNGKLPDGTAVGQVEKRAIGIDLTFSMPKSASIMAYGAGDRRVLDANMSAVRGTMKWVEANLAEGRKDIDGRKVPFRTGNLVYALFQHDTSRSLDPQGHIHAVIANMTRMPGGKWQALHTGAIWRANSVIGSIYHAYLREGLEKLGYQLEPRGKHGTFEIANVPKAVTEAFSQRREDILAKAKALGITSPQGLRDITARTRDAKIVVEDREGLTREWREKAASLGFDGSALRAAAEARAARMEPGSRLERGYRAVAAAIAGVQAQLAAVLKPGDPLVDRGVARMTQAPAEARAQLAVASAVRILSQREAAFGLHQLTKTALDLGVKGVTAAHVEARVSILMGRGALVAEAARRDDGTIRMVTTSEALAAEQKILDLVSEGKGNAVPLVAPGEAPQRLEAASAHPLNAGQLGAAVMAVSASDRTVVVQGIAGSGKSTMLASVARVAEGEGRSVLGLAFQNKMVADLKEGAGIEAQTLASFIMAHERFVTQPHGDRFEEVRARFSATMVVVDETSMVSSADMLALLEISKAIGIERLVLVGDRQQLSSIDAGKSFAMIQVGGARMARMDENIRQRTDRLRAVAALANVGEARQALEVLGEDVIEHGDPAGHAAALWLGLSQHEREATAVFASGRVARAQINERIQAGLAAEGATRGEAVPLTVYETVNLTREELRYASSYRAGQFLEVGRGGAPEIGLRPGRYAIVNVGANGRIQIDTGSRRPVRFDPQKLRSGEKRDVLQLSERKTIELREGDRIRWTASDKARGLFNAGLARVAAIGPEGISVEIPGQARLLLAPDDPMLTKLDLAYSLNMHMAQGITTDKAITVMSSQERNLTNQRLFNVGVTRVRDELRLIVDDKEKLVRQLDANLGNKTSALETIGRLEIDRARGTGMGKGMPQASRMEGGLSLPDDLPPRLEQGEGAGSPGSSLPHPAPSQGRGTTGEGTMTDRGTGVDPLPVLPERSLGLDL